MAYIDFSLKAPEAPPVKPVATPAPRAPRALPAQRIDSPRAALWIALGIGAVVAALFFALAFVSIGEPVTAGLVTILLLLPAAALFGGDGRRRR
ncbi:hypothetical protein [Sphingomonas sp.]|uniref:hypothetical protein n=1 Tax=Sphingomonas sp. TaxID=28214 RepID=UPI000DB518F1|nr:hypothetical protein [Sphingomonas sp.]PZU07429.1 MAG: hypothetical protein DI605_15270 [Sphingomonas sp.]